MKVTLAPAFEPVKAPGTVQAGQALLDPAGPECVLGWRSGTLAEPIAPAADTLFGPRGVCWLPDGSLWVADTGHHRLLGWRARPREDNAPAELIIGQPDFAAEGRNACGLPSAQTLNVPTGVCAYGRGLAVADAWNHRVLVWLETPQSSHREADIILGQDGPDKVLANRGEDIPSASSLNWPYGVSRIGERLLVCDTGNRRVLVWDAVTESGQAADRVLGQSDFVTRDENAGGAVSGLSMRWPHQAVMWGEALAVSDAGNNRIMLWERLPEANGVKADHMLGQADMRSCDHNMGSYYPSARCLNMPYALAVAGERLLVADTANSRIIGWKEAATGAAADRLSGQPDFASKGDNRWGAPVRDSLCWPYGLDCDGTSLAIADSGNNRVLLWRLA